MRLLHKEVLYQVSYTFNFTFVLDTSLSSDFQMSLQATDCCGADNQKLSSKTELSYGRLYNIQQESDLVQSLN